jgi:hypothetical protein
MQAAAAHLLLLVGMAGVHSARLLLRLMPCIGPPARLHLLAMTQAFL